MLKVLMLRKKLDDKKKALEALRGKNEDFEKREAELEAAIEETTTDEERTAVEAMIDGFEAEKAAHAESVGQLEREVSELEEELAAEEKENEAPAEAEAVEPVKPVERRNEHMNIRAKKIFGHMSEVEVRTFVERDDVKAFLAEIRSAVKEKRALTNVGLIVPEPIIGLLKANVLDYSKLVRRVATANVSGNGRQLIEGTIPEAVWTECCANLNELDLGFADWEFDCYRVAGFFPVCNANLEDSDIDLAAELVDALGQAIGLALDKAILFGTGVKMPLGVVTRLAQTSQPGSYPVTARTWKDLHSTHILKINGGSLTDIKLFQALIEDSAVADDAYGRGELLWCMNSKTRAKIVSKSLGVNAAGALVAGVQSTMPGLGGDIEVFPFIADNDIIVGYFDLYKLAERGGAKFASSEAVRFLQDQTVFKGTARYDGAPMIAEAFVIVNINNTNPTTSVTFAPDNANTPASE